MGQARERTHFSLRLLALDRSCAGGSTALVYQAEDRDTGTQVALKVLHGPERVPREAVEREIAFGCTITHDNLVRLIDVFAEGRQLIIVWELVRGCDLQVLLCRCGGRMPEDMAAFFFTQALRGLVFMHANGFCHRDIKPENCMVDLETQQLKLIDFGLSKHLHSAKTLGVGTPELLKWYEHNFGHVVRQGYDARRVDAWAMGVLMYLLVTGRCPFEDPANTNNVVITINNIRAGRMKPVPPGLSRGCADMILGLLQPKPENRTTLEELLECEWLASSARRYARTAPLHDGSPPVGSGPSPLEQWIDLRAYREVAVTALADAEEPRGAAAAPTPARVDNPHHSSAAAAPAGPAVAPATTAVASQTVEPDAGERGGSWSQALQEEVEADVAAAARAMLGVAGVHPAPATAIVAAGKRVTPPSPSAPPVAASSPLRASSIPPIRAIDDRLEGGDQGGGGGSAMARAPEPATPVAAEAAGDRRGGRRPHHHGAGGRGRRHRRSRRHRHRHTHEERSSEGGSGSGSGDGADSDGSSLDSSAGAEAGPRRRREHHKGPLSRLAALLHRKVHLG
ncbi:hypothetical protein GPECTOR_2g1358 [Gonium pectorale]|uniref:Protein kinase domain-containing protein n=1 Tax=Gonium pectorale TaxID=33097 RepID=A0A150H1T5_GONPE|nr:hypothetical protein GPECTOR_2g1358 [Gonium pectorale]|eukprot:KXZ55808.1 hypothetical protein GPECTOR_2g1358 [Gonium pectorale]